MSAPNSNRGLSDVAEAAGISRLLAEVSRRPARTAPIATPPAAATPEHEPPVRPAEAFDDVPVGEVFGRANWRNQPQVAEAAPPPVHTEPSPASPAGRDHVPVGALALADVFALVNWRNRPEEAKPRPVIEQERPPGYEWTVEAVMSAFFGD